MTEHTDTTRPDCCWPARNGMIGHNDGCPVHGTEHTDTNECAYQPCGDPVDDTGFRYEGEWYCQTSHAAMHEAWQRSERETVERIAAWLEDQATRNHRLDEGVKSITLAAASIAIRRGDWKDKA